MSIKDAIKIKTSFKIEKYPGINSGKNKTEEKEQFAKIENLATGKGDGDNAAD